MFIVKKDDGEDKVLAMCSTIALAHKEAIAYWQRDICSSYLVYDNSGLICIVGSR